MKEKQRKVLQISQAEVEVRTYEAHTDSERMCSDDLDLIRKPSAFNLSSDGKIYASCPLCEANYHRGATPCILTCNHTFCYECLEGLVKQGKVECPRCYKMTELGSDGVDGLPRNYALTSLAELDCDDLQRRPTCFILESLEASCPICLETFSDVNVPLKLPCGHTACDSCIMLIAQKAASEMIECPTCRVTVDLNKIAANLDLKKTVESVKMMRKHLKKQAEKKASMLLTS